MKLNILASAKNVALLVIVCGTNGSTFFEGSWIPPEINDDFLTKLVASLEKSKEDIKERKSSLKERKNYEKTKSQLEPLENKTRLSSRDKDKKKLRKLEISKEKLPYIKGNQNADEVDELFTRKTTGKQIQKSWRVGTKSSWTRKRNRK